MTAQGKDGDTNVHRRVAANSYHVGTQSEASKRACLQPKDKSEGVADPTKSVRTRMDLSPQRLEEESDRKRLSLHHKGTFTTRSQHPVLQVAIVDEG